LQSKKQHQYDAFMIILSEPPSPKLLHRFYIGSSSIPGRLCLHQQQESRAIWIMQETALSVVGDVQRIRHKELL
jgi:hypothetical protein